MKNSIDKDKLIEWVQHERANIKENQEIGHYLNNKINKNRVNGYDECLKNLTNLIRVGSFDVKDK